MLKGSCYVSFFAVCFVYIENQVKNPVRVPQLGRKPYYVAVRIQCL